MNGLLWWSSDRATVGLIVRRGVVVDAPPYARRWALGRKVAELPAARESIFVTDENTQADAEGVDWGGTPESAAAWSPEDYPSPAKAAVTYPEYGPLPEAPISINFRPGDKPQITVRGHSAQDITRIFNDLEENGVYANIAAAMASLNAQGPLGAGLGPVSPVGPPQAPQGPPAAPQGYGAPSSYPPQGNTPPPFGPNVSVPAAPGYVGPPAPQGGSWGGQQQGGGRDPKPRPAGWAMVDVPFNDKDRFKALRQQGTDSGNFLRGKVQWGGKGTYWLDPSVAGWLAQQGFPVMQ